MSQSNQLEKKINVSISKIQEIIILWIISIIFLWIGFHFSSRLNPVWMDEAVLVEPATNLYFGQSYHSFSWWQYGNEFHVSVSPLYVLTIYGWMKIFGFNIVAIRLLNYTLALSSAWMLWLSTIKLKLINTSIIRILFVVLILTGEGITFIYTAMRYDILSMTLVSATVLIYSISKSSIRYICLVILGFLYPFSGISLLVYSLLMCIFLFLFQKKIFAKLIAFILSGQLLGFITLYCIYLQHGVLETFKMFTLSQSAAHEASKDLIDKLIQRLSLLTDIGNNINKNYLNDGIWSDVSFQTLWIFLLLIILLELKLKKLKFTSLSVFGLLVSTSIPVGMVILGKYPLYYTYMGYIPLVICLCSSFDRILNNFNKFSNKLFLLAFFITLCLYSVNQGLPESIRYAIKYWQSLDYSLVEKFVQKNIRSDDTFIYSDFSAMYAVKAKNRTVIFPPYIHFISYFPIVSSYRKEMSNISVLAIDDTRWDSGQGFNPSPKEVMAILGGEWYETDSLNTGTYHLKIYRRK
jgi:hypothetical protein